MELPEDTCVAVVDLSSVGYAKEGETRVCMKRRDHYRHQPHFWYDNTDCTCTSPALHHDFVMGGRPVSKLKRLCDLWND